MLVIGITGSLATGKSIAAKMFRKKGARILDADTIVHHQITKGTAGFKAVVRAFGPEILTESSIDRRKLAGIVFSDPKKLRILTRILHPLAFREIKKEIKQFRRPGKKQFIIIDAPLLIEAGWHREVDVLIVVKSTRSQQLSRITRHTRIPRAEALRRIKMQMPIAEKLRQADIIIDNRGSLKQTQKQVDAIWRKLSEIKQTK